MERSANKPYQLGVGDLVKIKEGTHDEQIPDHRIGLIVGRVTKVRSSDGDAHIYEVRVGHEILRFHGMWLEKV